MVILSKYEISIYFSVWEYFPDIFCLSDGGCIFSPQPQQWTGWQAVAGTGYLCLNILTYSRDSGQRCGSPFCGLWLVHLPCTGLWLAGSDQLLTWCGGARQKNAKSGDFLPGTLTAWRNWSSEKYMREPLSVKWLNSRGRWYVPAKTICQQKFVI